VSWTRDRTERGGGTDISRPYLSRRKGGFREPPGRDSGLFRTSTSVLNAGFFPLGQGSTDRDRGSTQTGARGDPGVGGIRGGRKPGFIFRPLPIPFFPISRDNLDPVLRGVTAQENLGGRVCGQRACRVRKRPRYGERGIGHDRSSGRCNKNCRARYSVHPIKSLGFSRRGVWFRTSNFCDRRPMISRSFCTEHRKNATEHPPFFPRFVGGCTTL